MRSNTPPASSATPEPAVVRAKGGRDAAFPVEDVRSPDGSWPGGRPAAGEGVAPLSEASGPYRSVGFTISSAGYAIARRFRAILAPLELEPREFALLRAVSVAEGQSQQAISEQLQIPASRMVAFVDALAARGLLERRQNEGDRRAHALHLTEQGHSLLREALVLAVAHERDICGDLSASEREQLLALLGCVVGRLELPRGAHSALADE